VLFLTTALFNHLSKEVPSAFNSVRHLLFGGEAVDPRWVKEVLKNGPPQRLLHVYGPTEKAHFGYNHSHRSPPTHRSMCWTPRCSQFPSVSPANCTLVALDWLEATSTVQV